jgi:hypothetical protein
MCPRTFHALEYMVKKTREPPRMRVREARIMMREETVSEVRKRTQAAESGPGGR